ncbi:MAG: ATP synthase F1 subunit epsilon [Actinomycetota bacterium]|nr:ATP synthase F1 subunit epsilon [Actinomycetota bacterium]
MARTPFRVEVLTPEGEVFNEEVEMVSTHTSVGSVGILANHQPMLAMLDPTELRIHRAEGEVLSFAQGEGFLQVGASHALLLVDEVRTPQSLDAADLRERVRAAQDRVTQAQEGSEEHRSARREERRYGAWLKLLEGAGGH